MCILKFLDNLFDHSFFSTALSGFGFKIISKPKINKETIPQSNPIPITMSVDTYLKDIDAIKESIDHDINYKKKQTFLHYFNKYKHKFNSTDVEMLNNQFKRAKYSSDYADILSSLLGLIEAVYESE